MNKTITLGSFALSFALLFLVANGCNSETEVTYHSLVEEALQSGERHDSLFLGYYLGMSRQDFRSHSWDMNQQGIVTGLTKVEYKTGDWLPYDANLEFFPDFADDRISGMPVSIHYAAWAPWNPERSSDSLKVHLAEYLEKTYDQEFHRVFLPEQNKAGYFSAMGNRGISIWRRDDMWVSFEIRDLTITGPEL